MMAERAEIRAKKRAFLEAEWESETGNIPGDSLILERREQIWSMGALWRENRDASWRR